MWTVIDMDWFTTAGKNPSVSGDHWKYKTNRK